MSRTTPAIEEVLREPSDEHRGRACDSPAGDYPETPEEALRVLECIGATVTSKRSGALEN